MKRFLAMVLMVVVLLGNFNVTVFAENCEHQWKLEYEPNYIYACVDCTYHILDRIELYYICALCSKEKVETQSGNGEQCKHLFNENVCYTCGYVRVEETTTPDVTLPNTPAVAWQDTPEPPPTNTPEGFHNGHTWYEKHSRMYEYSFYNEKYHFLDSITIFWGCDCGENKTEVLAGNCELSKHSFSGNKCDDCGYVKAVTPNPQVTSNIKEEIQNTPTAKPTNSPAILTEHICRFEAPHQVWIGAYTETTATTHTQQKVTFAYCLDCGKKKIFSNEAQVVEHTLENGICKWCKYQVRKPTSQEIAFANTQINELYELLTKVESFSKNNKIRLSEDNINSAISKINTLLYEYNSVLEGKRNLDGLSTWQDDGELVLFSTIKEEDFEEIQIPKLVDGEKIHYISIEKPDNRWYYWITDAGEQVLYGNFTEKVTVVGFAGQVIVGELPVVGTMADIRDVVADVVNWELTWSHVTTTALDIIGIIPIVGALKYVDDVGFGVKAVKLSDGAGDILTSAIKHSDDLSDIAQNSDEIGEVVVKAFAKHADDVGDVSKIAIKNFDDLLGVIKHPEYFGDGILEHIFKGNKAGGFHYEGLLDANGKVLQITKPANKYGVYEAIVEIGGKVKKQPTTFFPKSWTAEEVIEAIEKVYRNPSKVDNVKDIFEGTVNGVNIRICLDETGKIVTAYPILD